MRVFEHRSSLWLPRSLEDVFPFFSEARNLEEITPPWLRFEILTPEPISMAVGTVIDYRLRLRGVPLRWRSEIAAWQPPNRFVDRQVRGPYRLWHHEHLFTERDGGTDVDDVVHYATWGGVVIDRLFVRRDVARIFAYRARKLREIFHDEPVTPPLR